MLRSRRVHWLVAVAALAGLAAVATVVVDKLNGNYVRLDDAAFLRSLAEPPPPGATPDELVDPEAALVAGAVLTVHGSAVCSGGTRPEVMEDDEAVSVRIQSYLSADSDVLCIPEGSPTATMVELDRPLGDRRLVDAVTGDPIPVMPAADVLRPTELPSGWRDTRTSVDAHDGVITGVVTLLVGWDTYLLRLRQAPDTSGVHASGAAHSGTVDVNGATAHWLSRPMWHDYFEITWAQNGYGMSLVGRADDLSTLVTIARSVE